MTTDSSVSLPRDAARSRPSLTSRQGGIDRLDSPSYSRDFLNEQRLRRARVTSWIYRLFLRSNPRRWALPTFIKQDQGEAAFVEGGLMSRIRHIGHRGTIRLPQQVMGAQTDPLFLSARTGEPLVIADAVVFLPTWWYSDSTTRAEIHYLSDLSYAVKNPDFIPEYALTLEQPFGAPKFDDYKEFLSTHREFLLYCVGMPRLEWIKDRLIHEGWNVVLIRSEGSKKIYRVTKPDS